MLGVLADWSEDRGMFSAKLIFASLLLVQESKVLFLLFLVVLRDGVYYSFFEKASVLGFLVRGDCFVVQKLVENDPISNVSFVYRVIRLLENTHRTLCSGLHGARLSRLQICELGKS